MLSALVSLNHMRMPKASSCHSVFCSVVLWLLVSKVLLIVRVLAQFAVRLAQRTNQAPAILALLEVDVVADP